MKKPAKKIKIKVYNSPPHHAAFGWYNIGSIKRSKAAIIDINVLQFAALVESKKIKSKDLPYFVAETVMHEVIHVLEEWAKVEFNHRKIASLLSKLRKEKIRGLK